MIPAPPLYPGELVSSWLVRCCRWFELPFKRFAREVLGMPSLRLNFLNLWPLRPLEALLPITAEELLWRHTVFPYATAFLAGESFEEALRAALDGGPGMSRLLAAMQNVSAELAFRRFCPRCVKESLAQHGETYWERPHNLPGALLCARHRCELVVTGLPARGTLKTIYELPVECEPGAEQAQVRPSKPLLDLARASAQLLNREPGPGRPRTSEWYRQLAITTGWLSSQREVSLAALQKLLLRSYPPALLAADGNPADKLQWAALCFRPAINFNLSPLRNLLVETALTARRATHAALDHVPPGPGGTSCQDVDAFYAPKAARELRQVLAEGVPLTTEQFLRRVGAFGPYRHRAQQLPSLRQVVLAFRGSPASVKPLGVGKTLYRSDNRLVVPPCAQRGSQEG